MLGCIHDVRQLEHGDATGWEQDSWNGRNAKKECEGREGKAETETFGSRPISVRM